jgi:cobalt-zinc-cadmium efflux system outer membrane protein
MKKRHWGAPSVLAAALMACLPPGFAQTGPSLRQGFDAAWARQPEERAAPLRREAAAAQLDAARRWTPEPPSLELSARTDQLNRNDGLREVDAAVAVPLWLPGERTRAEAAAAAEATGLDARLAAAQWRLAGEVREAHWGHRRAQMEHALAQQRLDSARQLAADVARRVKAGDLARSDGHQAEAAAEAAQGALAEAEATLIQAAQAWSVLTGQPTAGEGSEPRPTGGAPGQHPVLRELATRSELARRQRDLAAVQTRANPELTIGTGHERSGFAERYGQTVTVGIRIPLGSSGASRSRHALAGAELAEAEGQLELEAHRLRAQAETARARVLALEAAQVAAERRAVLARESRGFFDKSFRAGESDLPTRLRTELEAFEAERQALRARVEVDAAVSQLRQALGLLPE